MQSRLDVLLKKTTDPDIARRLLTDYMKQINHPILLDVEAFNLAWKAREIIGSDDSLSNYLLSASLQEINIEHGLAMGESPKFSFNAINIENCKTISVLEAQIIKIIQATRRETDIYLFSKNAEQRAIFITAYFIRKYNLSLTEALQRTALALPNIEMHADSLALLAAYEQHAATLQAFIAARAPTSPVQKEITITLHISDTEHRIFKVLPKTSFADFYQQVQMQIPNLRNCKLVFSGKLLDPENLPQSEQRFQELLQQTSPILLPIKRLTLPTQSAAPLPAELNTPTVEQSSDDESSQESNTESSPHNSIDPADDHSQNLFLVLQHAQKLYDAWYYKNWGAAIGEARTGWGTRHGETGQKRVAQLIQNCQGKDLAAMLKEFSEYLESGKSYKLDFWGSETKHHAHSFVTFFLRLLDSSESPESAETHALYDDETHDYRSISQNVRKLLESKGLDLSNTSTSSLVTGKEAAERRKDAFNSLRDLCKKGGKENHLTL